MYVSNFLTKSEKGSIILSKAHVEELCSTRMFLYLKEVACAGCSVTLVG